MLTLYAATLVLFVALDALMLSTVMSPLFRRHLGDAILPKPRLLPAALFYAGYVAGLVWLVSAPALAAGAPGEAALKGAVVGFMAYATYEFSNWATLRDWHPAMVAADLAWGTVLTAVAAGAGVWIAQAVGA